MENTRQVVGILFGLFVFGVLYNLFVARLEGKGHDRGYMAFLVIVGCTANIIGVGFLIGWQAAWVVFLCFAASGISMTVGSVCRHIRARTRDEEIQQEVLGRLVCPKRNSVDTNSTEK